MIDAKHFVNPVKKAWDPGRRDAAQVTKTQLSKTARCVFSKCQSTKNVAVQLLTKCPSQGEVNRDGQWCRMRGVKTVTHWLATMHPITSFHLDLPKYPPVILPFSTTFVAYVNDFFHINFCSTSQTIAPANDGISLVQLYKITVLAFARQLLPSLLLIFVFPDPRLAPACQILARPNPVINCELAESPVVTPV